MSKWNYQRAALLKQHHANGLSFGNIAVAINEATQSNFTRNAVIGKSGRMGLAARVKQKRPRGKDGGQTSGLVAKLWRPPKFKREAATEIKSEAAAPFLGIPLLELTDGQCRFPRGEPVLFCGQPTIDGSSYCQACHQVCYLRLRPPSEADQVAGAAAQAKRTHNYWRNMRAA